MNDNDFNAGDQSTGSDSYAPDNSAPGTQGGEGQGQNYQGRTPGNQNGGQTDPRDAQIAKYRQEVQRLNAIVAKSGRGSNQNRNGLPGMMNRGQGNQSQNQDGSPFESPEGQYAISLQLATAELGRQMEDIYDMYPEVSAKEIAQIRRNPWAYTSHDNYIQGNVEGAKIDIETHLLSRATELSGGQGGQNGNGVPQGNPPARINSNPAQETPNQAEPGSPEDQDPWTMPMDQLEKAKNRELAKRSKKS